MKKFETIEYENSNFPVVICDNDFVVLWNNESFLETFSVKNKEVIKTSIVNSIDTAQKNIIKNKLVEKNDFKINSIGFLSFQCDLIFMPKVDYFVVFITKNRYVNVSKSVTSDLLANVASNYRHSLFSIFNMAQPILTTLEENENYKEIEYLNLITKNCFSMLKTITNSMEFYKSTFEDYAIEDKKINFKYYFNNICSNIKTFLFANGIDFEYNEIKQNVETCFDHEKLTIVIVNIVLNACVYKNVDPKISISSSVVGENIVIKIRDNGIGIKTQDLEKIFEPYYSHNENEVIDLGTGIGLSLSKNIIEKMGGNILLSSKEGQGTSITLKLPLVEPDECLLEVNINELNYIKNKFSILNVFLSQLQ